MTFRGLLGGERPGHGWFYETKDHFPFMEIRELLNKGTEIVLAPIGASDDDDEMFVRFFSEKWPYNLSEMFPEPAAAEDVMKFITMVRAMIAENFNGALSERILVLAGRFDSAAERPRMVEYDQLKFLTIVDWNAGIAKFDTGETVYSLHAAYGDELNAALGDGSPERESATLRARKARAVTVYLADTYPEGVPESVSGGALASQVAAWFKERGFDDGISDKTVYRVRRAYNATKRTPA